MVAVKVVDDDEQHRSLKRLVLICQDEWLFSTSFVHEPDKSEINGALEPFFEHL